MGAMVDDASGVHWGARRVNDGTARGSWFIVRKSCSANRFVKQHAPQPHSLFQQIRLRSVFCEASPQRAMMLEVRQAQFSSDKFGMRSKCFALFVPTSSSPTADSRSRTLARPRNQNTQVSVSNKYFITWAAHSENGETRKSSSQSLRRVHRSSMRRTKPKSDPNCAKYAPDRESVREMSPRPDKVTLSKRTLTNESSCHRKLRALI